MKQFIGLILLFPICLISSEADVKINVSQLARRSIMMSSPLRDAEAQLYHGTTGFSLHRGNELVKVDKHAMDKTARMLTQDNLVRFFEAGGKLELTPVGDDSVYVRAHIPGKGGWPVVLWNGKWTGWVGKQVVRAVAYMGATAATVELTKVIVKGSDWGIDKARDAIVSWSSCNMKDDAIVLDAMTKRAKGGIGAMITAGMEARQALACVPGAGIKKAVSCCNYIGVRGVVGAMTDAERRTAASAFVVAYPHLVEIGQDVSKVLTPTQIAVWNMSKKAMSNKEFVKAMGGSMVVNLNVPVTYYARGVEAVATAVDLGCQAAGSYWPWLP